MEHRKIGTLSVSLVGIGCNNFGWRIDEAKTTEVVDAALNAGINFFDTADMYGAGRSEEYLGKAINGRRHKVVIATKFGMKMGEGMEGAKPPYVKKALEASLRRLGVDVIDLYQLHSPDMNTPIADTLGALNDAVKAGMIREIGCSNFSVDQLRAANAVNVPAHFVSVQNEYSMFHREAENGVLQECILEDLRFLPYFPLANGLLTGKYRKGQPFPESSRAKDGFGPKIFTDENMTIVEKLIPFAESRGHTLLELAFSWLAARSEIPSIIAGAKSADQVRANAKAADWKLSADDLTEVDRILRRKP